MSTRIHYIDPALGDDANDGRSPARPVKGHAGRDIRPGDTVLFQRGSVIRGPLQTRDGAEGAPVTYGAYGEGQKPTFLGSVAVGDLADWTEVRPNVWRFANGLDSEVCNLVFNAGQSCGILRWEPEDLRQPGDWHYTGIGATSAGESWGGPAWRNGTLYLCSVENPGHAWRDIECVLWGARKLVGGRRHLILEHLSFRNSGVHGFQDCDVRDVTIRDCDFRHVGGAVWHRQRRIRFGNAIELWDGAWDITVERCTFDTIYDSGVTHQGGETRHIPARLNFRHNRFTDCGMAAYECREPSQEVYFEHNRCVITGGGFGLQGEPPPRQSEIHPQPMGHHVFIWRIEPGAQPGRVYLRNNRFGEAPHGAAIYSIIAPADERQFVLDGNTYAGRDDALLARWGGRDYRMEDFARYQQKSGETGQRTTEAEGGGPPMTTNRHEFMLETLVDFPDDAIGAPEPIGEAHIDAMMRRLAECGVGRVSWSYYADGRGGFLTPAHDPKFANLANTYQGLGQNPLAVAVAAAHRHGLEIYAYFKPYETGAAALFPQGSIEAALYGRLSRVGGRLTWMDPFVADHPHLRIKRRRDDLDPELVSAPIRTLKLRKADNAPTRVTREHLQIWVSDLNYRYRRADVPFTLMESIEPCPHDVRSLHDGAVVARRGDPQRVLTLHGLDVRDPYVLVTTDFSAGPTDFTNSDLELLTAWSADGREIPGEIASGTAIWFADRVDFRKWGLMFDTGYNGNVMALDEPNANGKSGIIAFARGRNAYLPGALCETEPAVQAFWMDCISDMLDAGVDGIDFREESHSTHTNHFADYGYNDIVLDECRRRGGVDRATIAAVRGDAYTAFLARARQRMNARGRKMRINFQIDWYRPDPADSRRLAYPDNLDFQWQRWIEEDLTDEAVLRFYQLPFACVFEDAVAQALIARCQHKGIPVTVNRYIKPDELTDECRRVRQDGRFAGFILYEASRFLDYRPGGGCDISMPVVNTLKEQL